MSHNKWKFVTIVLALGLMSMACEIPETDERPTPRPKPTATAAPAPPSVDDAAAMAVPSMMAYARVRDAAVSQDGKTLSLVLIVDYATDPSYTQQLGDNFVRLMKSLLQDGETSSERIGKGKYDYLIGIYYPNEKPVAMGAKSRVADDISW